MSNVFEAATVHAFLADYAVVDPIGKLQVVGGGVTVLGLVGGVTPPMTSPCYLVIIVAFPARLAGQPYSFEIELRDHVGDLVKVPVAPLSAPQPLRIAQMGRVPALQLPATIAEPKESVSQLATVAGFPSGLPLTAGESYTWRVKIDSSARKSWRVPFSVLATLPDPVIGGPDNGAIVGVEDLTADLDDPTDDD